MELPIRDQRDDNLSIASGKVGVAIIQISQEHNLTYGEVFSILSHIGANFAKYMIQDERQKKEMIEKVLHDMKDDE